MQRSAAWVPPAHLPSLPSPWHTTTRSAPTAATRRCNRGIPAPATGENVETEPPGRRSGSLGSHVCLPGAGAAHDAYGEAGGRACASAAGCCRKASRGLKSSSRCAKKREKKRNFDCKCLQRGLGSEEFLPPGTYSCEIDQSHEQVVCQSGSEERSKNSMHPRTARHRIMIQ